MLFHRLHQTICSRLCPVSRTRGILFHTKDVRRVRELHEQLPVGRVCVVTIAKIRTTMSGCARMLGMFASWKTLCLGLRCPEVLLVSRILPKSVAPLSGDMKEKTVLVPHSGEWLSPSKNQYVPCAGRPTRSPASSWTGVPGPTNLTRVAVSTPSPQADPSIPVPSGIKTCLNHGHSSRADFEFRSVVSCELPSSLSSWSFWSTPEAVVFSECAVARE